MKCSLALVVCLIGLAAAYESYIPNAKHEDYPGKCYHKDTDHAFAVDEVYKPVEKDICQKYTCQEENLIRVNACPKYTEPTGCKEEKGDITAAYPDCCNVLRCTEDGKEVVRKTAFD